MNRHLGCNQYGHAPGCHHLRGEATGVDLAVIPAPLHAADPADSVRVALATRGRGLGNPDPEAGAADLVAAGRAALPTLDAEHADRLRSAVEATEQAETSTQMQQATRTLHAILTDSVSGAPSTIEVERLASRNVATFSALNDAIVARSLGQADDADVEAAQAAHTDSENAIHAAYDARHDATRERVAEGRPSLYDLRDSEARVDVARTERRKAVLAADAARDHYEANPKPVATHLAGGSREEFAAAKTRLDAANEATRAEQDAIARYDQAEIEMLDAQNAWNQMLGENR